MATSPTFSGDRGLVIVVHVPVLREGEARAASNRPRQCCAVREAARHLHRGAGDLLGTDGTAPPVSLAPNSAAPPIGTEDGGKRGAVEGDEVRLRGR